MNTQSLPLLGQTSGGCACSHSGDATSTATPGTNMEKGPTLVYTQTFAVTGMTCGHCVQAVRAELSELDGVSDVAVDLIPGGTSLVTVTATSTLDESRVVTALDEAGDYRLAQ